MVGEVPNNRLHGYQSLAGGNLSTSIIEGKGGLLLLKQTPDKGSLSFLCDHVVVGTKGIQEVTVNSRCVPDNLINGFTRHPRNLHHINVLLILPNSLLHPGIFIPSYTNGRIRHGLTGCTMDTDLTSFQLQLIGSNLIDWFRLDSALSFPILILGFWIASFKNRVIDFFLLIHHVVEFLVQTLKYIRIFWIRCGDPFTNLLFILEKFIQFLLSNIIPSTRLLGLEVIGLLSQFI